MFGCSPAGTSQDRASKNRAPSSVLSRPFCCAGSHAGFLTGMPPPFSSHTVPATPFPELAPPPPIHGQKATFVLVRQGKTGAPEGAFWALTSPRWPLWPLCLDHRWRGELGAGAGGTSAWRTQPGNVIGRRPSPPMTLWQGTWCSGHLPVTDSVGTSSWSWKDLKVIEPVPRVRAGAPERDASYTRLSVSNARNSVLLTGYSCQGLLSLCLPVPRVSVGLHGPAGSQAFTAADERGLRPVGMGAVRVRAAKALGVLRGL